MTARKTAPSTIPPAKLALYEKLIATDASIERKGATIPYTSANGKMFTYLSPTGELRLRLPEPQRAAFVKKYRTKLAVSYGVVQKDFVAVPPGLLGRTAELTEYLGISHAYAEQLGAKTGTKRAPTTATKNTGAAVRGEAAKNGGATGRGAAAARAPRRSRPNDAWSEPLSVTPRACRERQ